MADTLLFKIGGSDVSALYAGSTQCTKVYYGSVLIWERGDAPVPTYGTVTCIDQGLWVKGVYPNSPLPSGVTQYYCTAQGKKPSKKYPIVFRCEGIDYRFPLYYTCKSKSGDSYGATCGWYSVNNNSATTQSLSYSRSASNSPTSANSDATINDSQVSACTFTAEYRTVSNSGSQNFTSGSTGIIGIVEGAYTDTWTENKTNSAASYKLVNGHYYQALNLKRDWSNGFSKTWNSISYDSSQEFIPYSAEMSSYSVGYDGNLYYNKAKFINNGVYEIRIGNIEASDHKYMDTNIVLWGTNSQDWEMGGYPTVGYRVNGTVKMGQYNQYGLGENTWIIEDSSSSITSIEGYYGNSNYVMSINCANNSRINLTKMPASFLETQGSMLSSACFPVQNLTEIGNNALKTNTGGGSFNGDFYSTNPNATSGAWVFKFNSGLTKVGSYAMNDYGQAPSRWFDYPSTLTEIADQGYMNQSYVVIRATYPPTLAYPSAGGGSSSTLYVPDGSESMYQNASNYSNLFQSILPISQLPSTYKYRNA